MSQQNCPKTSILKLNRRLVCLIILAILVPFKNASSQVSNKGREFWVSYPYNYYFERENSQEMVLYLSAEQNAIVTVTSRAGNRNWVRTYDVEAGTVKATDFMPKTAPDDARLFDQTLPSGSEIEAIHNKAIHIESTTPIVVYAHYIGGATSGAAMLFPVEAYGYSYTTLNNRQHYSIPSYNYFYIMAAHDNTVVEVIPSIQTRNRPAGIPYKVTLNRFQSYQVVARSSTGDLTGSTIRSIANSNGECKPIAVFSGSSRTALGCSGTGNNGDFIMQQNFPSQAWGKRYLTAPTSNSTAASSPVTNIYRILLKEPNTRVYKNGILMSGLINRTYYEYSSITADRIEADKPVMVAQYIPSTGGATGCGVVADLGDPEMIYISPIEQAIRRVGFYRNTLERITVNYLTLIIPSAGLASLQIDGSDSFDHIYDHPNMPGYKVVVKRWTAAQAQCIVSSDSAFNAITYGLGSVESYGYNAGTFINNLSVISEIKNIPDPSSPVHLYTCRNTPVSISMLLAYKPSKIVWVLSKLAHIHPGADVTDNSPTPVDSLIRGGSWYYRYKLSGNYSFSDTGTFLLPVRNTHSGFDNCNNTQEVMLSIVVKGAPVADFIMDHSGCRLDTVRFSSPANTANGFSVRNWNWSFPDGSSSSASGPAKLFTSDGVQNIRLRIITNEGCIGDTVKPLRIFSPPAAALSVNDDSICEGSEVVLSGAVSYDGPSPVSHFYWSTTGTSSENYDSGSARFIYDSFGRKTIQFAAGISPSCMSDTLVKLVHVFARPRPGFTYPESCLPVDGIVQFNNTSSVPDSQTLNYSWEFGDLNASPSNPDQSTLESPTHYYSTGTYDIRLKVTTGNGCTKDTVVTMNFRLRPLPDFSRLTPVCENLSGTVSVAAAAVTNGVSGTGIYKGRGTTEEGHFSPSIAGPGSHTIWYVFTSDGHCMDSVSSTIQVHPKPPAGFTIKTNTCLDEPVIISPSSLVPGGQIIGWNWSFGDGTSASFSSDSAFAKSFEKPDAYTVKLVTLSDQNCRSDTISRIIKVHPVPVTDFNLPAMVCLPNGNATFNNKSLVDDNESLNWEWDYGDGSKGNTTEGSHVYKVAGSYSVKLTATSNFGCSDDTVKILDRFSDKPVAGFSVSRDTVCQGTENLFFDRSFSPNSRLTGWNWNFHDGSTSTRKNPVKLYRHPGRYDIDLVVTSEAGCTSDPFTKKVVVYLQPVIEAGPSLVVQQGTAIMFRPRVNDSVNLKFMWTPSHDFANPGALSQTLIARSSQTYQLMATGEGNCRATDELSVNVLKPVSVPNAFSPNGDGINDHWEIPNLKDYPGATVEIFNRYGQRIFHSSGYGKPWDGRAEGKSLPVATYYYVIVLKNGSAPLSGSVTIVK